MYVYVYTYTDMVSGGTTCLYYLSNAGFLQACLIYFANYGDP